MCHHRKPRHGSLAARARLRVITCDDAESVMFHYSGRHVEDDCSESRHDPDQCRQSQESDLRPKAILAKFHHFGNPAENSVHGHKTRRAWSHGVPSYSFCV